MRGDCPNERQVTVEMRAQPLGRIPALFNFYSFQLSDGEPARGHHHVRVLEHHAHRSAAFLMTSLTPHLL